MLVPRWPSRSAPQVGYVPQGTLPATGSEVEIIVIIAARLRSRWWNAARSSPQEEGHRMIAAAAGGAGFLTWSQRRQRIQPTTTVARHCPTMDGSAASTEPIPEGYVPFGGLDPRHRRRRPSGMG